MTNGEAKGTNGRRLVRAWLVALGLLGLVTFVNVSTLLDDARRRGAAVPLALPLTLEITSALAAVAACVVPLFAARLAPPGHRPIWRTAAIHFGGSLAYSAAHVALMTLARTLAFAAAGHHYSWTLAELPYEYRKDLISYIVIAGIFWVFTRPDASATTPIQAQPTPFGPATFDIREGASLVRAPVGEILAAQAAGNYVEFILEDGGRPLMRASMAQVEAALAQHGFVRTHRSWLVNAARVRALSAAGSGDFRLDLGAGVTVPLSRRYPATLARLRGEGRPMGRPGSGG